MPAGLVTIPFKDGSSADRTGQFLSGNASANGTLSPVHGVLASNGEIIDVNLQSTQLAVANTLTSIEIAAQSSDGTLSTISTRSQSQVDSLQNLELRIGNINETAAVSDSANSGLNGLLKRSLQQFTTFLTLLPASLGTKAANASLAVALSSEDSAKLSAIQAAAENTSSSAIRGGVAVDAAASEAPVYVAGRASNNTPTAVSADGDVVGAWYDRSGRQIVSLMAPRSQRLSNVVTITSNTANQTLIPGANGIIHDITALVFTNTDASVDTEVQILDADGTTVRFTMMVPYRDSRGIVFTGAGLKGASANSNTLVKTITAVNAMKVNIFYNQDS